MAKQVLDELCSGLRVARLRRSKPTRRDVTLESICLFNRDCLYLRQLKYAIKLGDAGAVLDVITLSWHFVGLAKLQSMQTVCDGYSAHAHGSQTSVYFHTSLGSSSIVDELAH